MNVPRRAAGSNSGGGGAARAGNHDQRQLQPALSGFGGGPPQQPPSSRSSATSSSSAGPTTPKGRGAHTILPDNFLRPPGWKPSAAPHPQPPQASPPATQQRIGATSTSSSATMGGGDGAASTDFAAGLSDDQLAILLQDEAFLTELRNQPDFLAMQEELYNHPQGLSGGQAGAPPLGSLPSAARPGAAGYPGSGSRGGGSSGSGSQGQQEGAAGAAGGAGWSTGMRSRLANLGAKFTRPKPSSSSGSAPGAAGRHYGGASGEYGALPSPTSGGYHDDDDGLQEVSFSAISTTRDSTSGLELSSTPSTEPSGPPSQGRSEAVPAAAGGGGGGSGGGPVPRLPPPPSHGRRSGGTSLGVGEKDLFSVLGAPGAVPAEDAAVALQASELAAVSSPSAAAGRGKTRRNAKSPPSQAGVESEDL